MTARELKLLEDKIVNCNLLHIAIHAIEQLRANETLSEELPKKWISEMKEESGYQVSQHDEDRQILLNRDWREINS